VVLGFDHTFSIGEPCAAGDRLDRTGSAYVTRAVCDSIKFDFDLIDEAPPPVFAGLERFHDRVLGVLKVFGGVFVFG
jgi:hypothetical protein